MNIFYPPYGLPVFLLSTPLAKPYMRAWTSEFLNSQKVLCIEVTKGKKSCTFMDKIQRWPYPVYSSVRFCLSPASQLVSQHLFSPSQAWRPLFAAHAAAPLQWPDLSEPTGRCAEPPRDRWNADAEPNGGAGETTEIAHKDTASQSRHIERVHVWMFGFILYWPPCVEFS